MELQKASLKHTQFVFDLYNDEQVMRAHGLHRPIPGPQWRKIIQGLCEGWQHIYVVAQGAALVGHVGFQDYSSDDRRAEVTVTITPSMQRRGLGTSSLLQALDLAFKSPSHGGMGLESLWAGVLEDNDVSHNIFMRLGFSRGGSLPSYYRFAGQRYARDFYHYSVEDYRSAKASR